MIDQYKAICQGGSGGKCTDTECEKCWPDPPIDTVVEAVRADLLRHSELGIKKYGVTLDRIDLSLKDWLQHAYEECLDQANYLKRAILTLEGKP